MKKKKEKKRKKIPILQSQDPIPGPTNSFLLSSLLSRNGLRDSLKSQTKEKKIPFDIGDPPLPPPYQPLPHFPCQGRCKCSVKKEFGKGLQLWVVWSTKSTEFDTVGERGREGGEEGKERGEP